jgi:integrase
MSVSAERATVGNDLTWIGVVLRAARSVKQLPVHPEIVEEARSACRELRLIAKSRRRDRRPTDEELAKLDAFFKQRDTRGEIPMRDIFWFAIHSARRQSEICQLASVDNDAVNRTGLVRDAKHPTSKEGNHRRFKYTPEAWEIVERQPPTGAFIFPYSPKSVGSAFTRACQVLGIKDLRFQDLRHEATSRLFERGYQIHEVAQFTLHDSWNELKRYANLRPERTRDIPSPHWLEEEKRAANEEFINLPALSDGQSAPRDRRQLTSQGDCCPPSRKARHGSDLADALRLASS